MNRHSAVHEYKFKFANKKFNLEDLSFECVCDDIKLLIDKKELSNNIIICLEESSPYGLFFAHKYSGYCKSIVCYPLRLNTKESLDRLHHKYITKKYKRKIS